MRTKLGTELHDTSDGFSQLAAALTKCAAKLDQVNNHMNLARAVYKKNPERAVREITSAGALLHAAEDGSGWPVSTGNPGITSATQGCLWQMQQVSARFNEEAGRIFGEIGRAQAWDAKMGSFRF